MSTIEELQRLLEETREKARREIELLKRDKEEAEARAEKEKQRAEQEVTRAERVEAREADTAQRLAVFEQREAPSRFLDYIRLIEENLYEKFTIEPDRSKLSSFSTTSVEGKFYPQHFQPWTDFATVHTQIFDVFTTTFGNDGHFTSVVAVENIGNDLSPKSADELGLRPFIRAAIEKPAAKVVSKYLALTNHPTIDTVYFSSNSYGLQLEDDAAVVLSTDDTEPARKRRSPVKVIGVPDRWLFSSHHDGKRVHSLVAEYKAAHNLKAAKISRVLSGPPGDDFFLRATKQDSASFSKNMEGEAYIAKVLCQAYHYLISSGLEFGYVASGDGLIFLRVMEDCPNTLYYFWSVFPVLQHPDRAATTREPRETAMAHLASLCICAVRSTPRPTSWIDARDKDVRRWPKSTAELSLTDLRIPLILPKDKDGGGGSAGAGVGVGASGGGSTESAASRSVGAQNALKRSRDSRGSESSPSGGGNTTRTHQIRSRVTFVVEPPILPYCTQACLRGLCRGLPLDRRCPNAELHQTAARTRSSYPRAEPDGHALTVDEVRPLVVAQLAENMDKDCECLDKYGCFGRHGVLFKITVTGFGYTLVAKAVQAVHRNVLQHEAAVYASLDNFQGRLIPVCLGLIDLERPLPLHTCARVPHMMLLSHAGPDLCNQKLLPSDVDMYLETERTGAELRAAGLCNDDVRLPNLAWSKEAGRVMQFDFDQAYVALPAPSPSPSPKPASPTCRSPLLAKRDLNAYCNSSREDEDDQVMKRARAAT